MQTGDPKCFEFLDRVVSKFNGSVPFVYPIEMFERLWAVDRLERLGISRYFKSEIKDYLDFIYRWGSPSTPVMERYGRAVLCCAAIGIYFLFTKGTDVRNDGVLVQPRFSCMRNMRRFESRSRAVRSNDYRHTPWNWTEEGLAFTKGCLVKDIDDTGHGFPPSATAWLPCLSLCLQAV
ncbi:monofunctional isopimaradiene synthase, chloroplastic-like isoform X2 [Miscanthus floridulus]|uniref:monofunctional isopimaradiene synthase, chloroplastic-like isoform X2 n=1 Tax=Miscanthus floridulus TaxID=154761 RepID=UPI003458EF89